MHPPTMAAAVVPRPPWCLTPGSAAHDNQLPGVGHHGGRCRQFTSRRVDGRCGVVVGCVLCRNTQGSIPGNQRCLPNEVRKSPLALELSAWQPPCRMGHCAASDDLVHHGGMMRCGSGVKEGRIEAGGDYSHTCELMHRLMMVVAIVLQSPQGPTPGF